MRKPHAEPSYDADLAQVRILLEDMAALTQQMLRDSLQALQARDAARAKQIAARDRDVNAREVEIDERCLKLLARWQPVASDLRFVGATLKMVTDLERVGDHCANICERVMDLGGDGGAPLADLSALIEAVPVLLRDALSAWEGEDTRLASQIIERSQRLDVLVREVVRSCLEGVRQHPDQASAVIHWFEVASYLHRIAAHAANIGELVIFLVRGEDVRHRGLLPQSESGERSAP